MTGTTEMLAEDIIDHYGREHVLTVLASQDADLPSIVTEGLLLVMSSTFGAGDVPPTGQALFKALGNARPDLRRLDYAVLALGDTNYGQTFAMGGMRWDHLLSGCGARRMHDTLVLDVSTDDISARALEWFGALAGIERADEQQAQTHLEMAPVPR
jgi:sulfite reductase alpha subunit-like flavoprotein